jgi:DNA-binding response OmpR family regulator
MRVLIVDDEEHLRRVMRLTLEAEGYEVVEAADGEDALRLFGDGSHLDATLLDQKMPGLDGLETLKRMTGRRADACVIMVTAYATIELAVDAMKLGATDFVRKPMTPETLRHAVAAALAKRGLPSPAITSDARSPAPPPPQSPPEIWTTNGFFIRRVAPGPAVDGRDSSEHHFIVRRGKDAIGVEVVVVIDPASVDRLRRECRRDFRPSGGFWHQQAEHALVNHLWSEAAVPTDGRLVIDRVSGPMVNEAMAWSGD